MVSLLVSIIYFFCPVLSLVHGLSSPSSIAEIHRIYGDFPEGKHTEERVYFNAIVQEVKRMSPRLTFLRVRGNDNENDDNNEIELLLKERDSFLSQDDIVQITEAVSVSRRNEHSPSAAAAIESNIHLNNSDCDDGAAIIHCKAYPEKLSSFDVTTFFPHLPALPAGGVVCLHVVAANVTLASTGEKIIVPSSKLKPKPARTLPGRMPPLKPRISNSNNRNTHGTRNRCRGGIFSSWVIDTFGEDLIRGTKKKGDQYEKQHILDIAGGSGQLAFQLGVRRGFNITVVDPRPLKLSYDQQSTLEYHRKSGIQRIIIPSRDSAETGRVRERDTSLPSSDYGYHFSQVNDNNGERENDRSYLVFAGGEGQKKQQETYVRHLQKYFNADFITNDDDNPWHDCSVVLGMHPDEPTEDIVDFSLKYDKPFAVVPCCVFWKRDPHRKTPDGTPVRTTEQFCEYLVAKDKHRIKVTTLPFPGQNTVLYYLGSK